MKYSLFATIAASALCITTAQAAPIVLQPDEAASNDVFMYEGLPTTNFDTDGGGMPTWGNVLGVSNTGTEGPAAGHNARSLIQFDLTGVTLEPGERATLNLYVVNSVIGGTPSTDSPVTVDLHANTGSWTETTVTWGDAPAYGETPSATQVVSGINQWITFDITDLVAAWLDEPQTNHGLTLVQRNISGAAAYFSSSAGDNRPFLAIPEPASVALLGVGAMVALGRRRRA